MKGHLLLAATLALLFAGANGVRAESSGPLDPEEATDDFELVEVYEPSAAAVAGAIAINLVYVPARFVFTVLGAALGGVEGILSAGNENAADKIWGLTDGSQVVTPAMLEGRERWTFSRYGW